MYEHLRMAIEHAQRRSQQEQQQSNLRRRRNQATLSKIIISESIVSSNDNERDNAPMESIDLQQPFSTCCNESSDVEDDFDLLVVDEDPNELHNVSYSNDESDDQNDLLVLENILIPDNRKNNNCLHPYTNMKTYDFCRKLVEIFRSANISNIHCSHFLKLINETLPQPHHLPTTLKSLYDLMQVDQLFTKRLICTECQNILFHNDKVCKYCASSDSKSIATVFDINQQLVFARMLDRLVPDIERNRQQILIDSSSPQNNNDIMFNKIYRDLQYKYSLTPFVSLLLHLDGIALSKSSRLNLWLFSCTIIELPVELRYRRCNTVVLSVWVGCREPIIDAWLSESLQQLNTVKKIGVPIRSVFSYKIVIYGLTGDCPAIKLATKHVNHQGYWCCWFCYTKGIHEDKKRQYYFENKLSLRSSSEYSYYSKEAQRTNTNIFGHLGVSPFTTVFDVPLPRCLIIDYMHVSLLSHTKTVIQYLYKNYLKPRERNELDELFRTQSFPHFFNRKMRPAKEFSYCKATELRNMLLYGSLPLIRPFVPVPVAAHLSFYVTSMRLLHGPRKLGSDTELVANQLISIYYKQINIICMAVYQILVFFGQELFLGYFSRGRSGTRKLGQIIVNNYNVNIVLQVMTTRRQVVPRQIYTPTQTTPPPSHYLIVFQDTDSYQIVARSSVKQVQGDYAFITIHHKLIKAKIIHQGSFEDCSTERSRLTRISQTESNSENDDCQRERINASHSYTNNAMHPKTNQLDCPPSVTSKSPVPTRNASLRNIFDQDDEVLTDEDSFFDCRKRPYQRSSKKSSKKKKVIQRSPIRKNSLSYSDDQDDDDDCADYNCVDSDDRQAMLEIGQCFLSNAILNNEICMFPCRFVDQQIQKLCTKIDRLASQTNVNICALEPFIDKSGEKFPNEVMFGSINLLDIMGTDYGDYTREVLRKVFTEDERKNCILPPRREYLKREPLDEDKYKLCMNAVRIKFKLDSVNFGLFYKSLLRRKITDFLIEERRRDTQKLARQSLKESRSEQPNVLSSD
ncbi:unnamed protein product [Rotaria socialis]